MTRTTAEERVSNLAETAFEHHSAALRRFLARRLARCDDASDIVQEVFLRLLRMPDVDFVRNPQAYLFGMASRVMHERRQKSRYERVTFDSEVVEQRAAHPPHVAADELSEWIGAQRQVEQALRQLTRTQFQVLMAEVRDGLTHPQIALKLGLTVHTVRKYSVQALARVRSGWDTSRSRGRSSGGADNGS